MTVEELPLLERAPRHDMLSFLTMKAYLPEFRIEKLLLDSAHDAYAVYEYCRREHITPFIDLNPGHTGYFIYKDDFTIDEMGSPSVSWVYVCIKMDMRPPNTGRNTVARKLTGNAAASVNIPVHRLNTAEPYISLPTTIPGYLTYRQGILMHGKRNMTEGLLRNAPTRARKRSIN